MAPLFVTEAICERIKASKNYLVCLDTKKVFSVNSLDTVLENVLHQNNYAMVIVQGTKDQME